MSLRFKLIISFLVVGLVPLVLLAFVVFDEVDDGLRAKAYQQLEGVRDMKKAQLTDYVVSMQDQLRLIKGDPTLFEAAKRFSAHFEKGLSVSANDPDGINDEWEDIAEEYDEHFEDMVQANGWYDLVLVSEDGVVMYSVTRDDDLGESLNGRGLSDSSLADVYRKVKVEEADRVAVSDFKPYAPAEDVPVAFMLTKMLNQECFVGLRIPVDRINAIMSQRAGMDGTGEAYLVGPDRLMRSDSIKDPEYHKVLTSFSNPQKGKIDTEAVQKALKGEKGTAFFKEYDGSEVLVAYAPFDFGGVQWALLAVVDEKEAYAFLQHLKHEVAMVVGVGLFFMIAAAWLISRSLTLPVIRTMKVVQAMSEGDLTGESMVRKKDEVGKLAMSIDRTVKELRGIISGFAEDSKELSNSSRDLAATSDNMAVGAQIMRERAMEAVQYGTGLSREIREMANTANAVSMAAGEVSGAVQDITVGIGDVAKQCAKGTQIANSANEKGQKASGLMAKLNDAAHKINQVTEIIGELAKRTNLLALNATIESASAGDAGKGFAVVAQEVKDLARQSAGATEQIADQIKGMQETAQFSVVAIEEITGIIEEMRGISQAIQQTMDGQLDKVGTISRSLNETTHATRQLAERLEASAVKSQSFAESIGEVSDAAEESTDGAKLTNESAQKLSGMAVRLKEIVERFKVVP